MSPAILAAVLVMLTPGTAWCSPEKPPAGPSAGPQGPSAELVEKGTVESAQSIVVRCEVASPDNSGTAVLQIVPNGTVVRQGDLLVKLDSSLLQDARVRQQVVVAGCSAAAKRAKEDLDTAKLAKQEYVEGTYVVQVQSIQNDIFVAERQLSRAEEDLKTIEARSAGKTPAPRELEDARFSVKKARNDLDLAKARLQVLEKLTKERTLRELNADVESAEANLKGDEANLLIAQDRLAQIDRQLGKCTIKAPVAGTAVHEPVLLLGARGVSTVQEGVRVRERQPILRLDDLSQLQVRARVHKSRIEWVKTGMRATMRVDALPDQELTGRVTWISEYPEPASLLAPELKEYAVVVNIDQVPPALRAGMTAEVRLRVPGGTGRKEAPKGTSRDLRIDQLFDSWDQNRDGRLEEKEVAPAIWGRLKPFDANGDGVIDRAEWRALQKVLPKEPAR